MSQPATPSVHVGRALASGMSVDCARRYLSVDTLKRFIDALSGHAGAFLQLHLTDNQNVGVECALLGQTAEKARLLPDGSYLNPHTGKRFLSSAQVRDLLRYAAECNVEIVPEIDAPAHMESVFALAQYQYGEAFVNSIAYARRDCPGELDVSSENAVWFVQRLYDEYAALFADCRCFHVGCDEHFSGSHEDKTAYIETISSYMRDKGFTVRMWNDLLTKDNIDGLDKRTQITYWSWDGDAQDPDRVAARRAERASVPNLQTAGFNVLIYNSYYLYLVPSERTFNDHDNDYTIWDLREHWTVARWNKNSDETLASTHHIVGSAVSLWNEESAPFSEDRIAAQFIRHYNAMSWVNMGTVTA